MVSSIGKISELRKNIQFRIYCKARSQGKALNNSTLKFFAETSIRYMCFPSGNHKIFKGVPIRSSLLEEKTSLNLNGVLHRPFELDKMLLSILIMAL